jgi:hypothetical protein
VPFITATKEISQALSWVQLSFDSFMSVIQSQFDTSFVTLGTIDCSLITDHLVCQSRVCAHLPWTPTIIKTGHSILSYLFVFCTSTAYKELLYF